MTYTDDEARALVKRLEANGARQSDEVRAAVTKDPAPARRASLRGAQPARETADTPGSPLEQLFLDALAAHGADLPPAVREYGWAEPIKHYRADFAWPSARLAIEVDGGQHAPGGGRHNTDDDRFKLNLAVAIFSWRVLRFSGAQLRNDPAACIALVRRALER